MPGLYRQRAVRSAADLRPRRHLPEPPAPGPECTTNAQCNGRLCVGNRCRGGELCFQNAECAGALECIENEDCDFVCLLPDQGFGECDPGPDALTPDGAEGFDCPVNCDNVCNGGPDNVDTFCALGACVVSADSPVCDADECDGENFAGLCVNLDEQPFTGQCEF